MSRTIFTLTTLVAALVGCVDEHPFDDWKPTPPPGIDDIDKRVARGLYLVDHLGVCDDCHTPRKDGAFDLTRKLAGIPCFIDESPNDPTRGCLATRNLTNHETGLKNRTDQEIKDMFLSGIRPDGTVLHPFMPYYVYGNMTDDDANAIVAYLRTVPGVDHMVGPSQAPFTPPAMPAPRWPDAAIPRPRPDYPNQAAAMRGRYLAGNIGICMECHTARRDGVPAVDRAFQGKNEFRSAAFNLPPGFPEVIYAPNLTPHATGILGYTVEDIVAVLKEAKDPNQGGSPLCPPMPAGPMAAYGGLTDGDAKDIAHYLLSIPPVENVIPGDCQPPAAPPSL